MKLLTKLNYSKFLETGNSKLTFSMIMASATKAQKPLYFNQHFPPKILGISFDPLADIENKEGTKMRVKET